MTSVVPDELGAELELFAISRQYQRSCSFLQGVFLSLVKALQRSIKMERPDSQHGPVHESNGGSHDGQNTIKPFMVSAPGKVIVFGEHAVVYGKVI